MALQWNDVRVNFNDTNSAMANAQSGISKVGTVFGELRKSILDEEQKAIENAYKQKVFDENVRQFGLQHALNQDKLAEQIRSNKANEANTIRGQDLNYKSTIRGQDLNYKSSMASVGAQYARLNFERSKWNAENALRQGKIQGYGDARATYADVLSKTGNVDKALSAAEQAFYKKAPESAFDYRLAIPTESAGLFTPAARASRAAQNDFQAGIAATNIREGEKVLADYERIINNSDGTNYADPLTGEVRGLTPEEQQIYNSYSTPAGEQARQRIMDSIYANKKTLEQTGVSNERAEQLSKRIGSGVGEAQIWEEAARRYGNTSPDSIMPSAVQRDRDIELNNMKSKRDLAIKEEVNKIEDQKPEAIDKSMNKFLSEGVKTVKDSESTIKAIPKKTVKEVQRVAELFKELGLGNRAFETYLGNLKQDLIEGGHWFSSDIPRADAYLERILEEAKGNGKVIPKAYIPSTSNTSKNADINRQMEILQSIYEAGSID